MTIGNMSSKKRHKPRKSKGTESAPTPTAPAASPLGVGRVVLGVAVLAVLTAAVYAPAVRGPFIFDDRMWLWDDPQIHGAVGDYWVKPQTTDYLPLMSTAFWAQWRLWGRDPAGYHVVNIVGHIAGALCLWALLRRLKVPAAWLASVIFAVHPVNVASVAWITELKNTLSLPLYLGAILAYLHYEDRRRIRWYATAMVLFALGLLAKQSIAILPLVLLGCVWWRRRKIDLGDWARAVPFFVLGIALAIVAVRLQRTQMIDGPANLFERLALAGRAIWFYLAKALWPAPVSLIYPMWDIHNPPLLAFIGLLAALAVAAALFAFRKSRTRAAAFGLGYYAIGLAPVLGFVDMSYMMHAFVADQWHYVALPGVIALAVGCAGYWAKRGGAPLRIAGIGAGVAVVAALSILTFRQASLYADTQKLWSHVLTVSPRSWAAHNHLAMALVETKNPQDEGPAEDHYLQAIRFNPRSAFAHNNLAKLYQRQGHREQAISYNRKAIEIKPNYANAYNNLAAALANSRKEDEAIECFRMAVRLNPRLTEAYYNMGVILSAQGRHGRAAESLRRYLEIKPDDDNARKMLAAAEAALQKND